MPANDPVLGLPYPLPTEPVTEGAQAIRNLAEAVGARLGYVGSAPPAGAIEGSEWIYPVGNGVLWRFRYATGSPSAYKWEFVGGTPARFQTAAATVNTPTPTPLAGGPFAVPFTGAYRVSFGATIQCVGTWAQTYDANLQPFVAAIPHGAPAKAILTAQYQGASVGMAIEAGLSAADSLTLNAWVSVATDTSYAADGFLEIVPVRVQ